MNLQTLLQFTKNWGIIFVMEKAVAIMLNIKPVLNLRNYNEVYSLVKENIELWIKEILNL